MASLTEADIPPDEDDLDGWADADPDCGPPAELADLTDAELYELLAAAPAQPAPLAWPLSYQSAEGPGGRPGQPWPAGFLPRDGSGHGAGFADGGVLDGLAPGPGLAGFADDAHQRLADVDDDALIGVLHGWRRLAAWAQAASWPRSPNWPAAARPMARRPPRPASCRRG
jgi:hypothetical protein